MQKIDYWLLTFFAVLRLELAKILPDVTRIYDKKFALAILVPQKCVSWVSHQDSQIFDWYPFEILNLNEEKV